MTNSSVKEVNLLEKQMGTEITLLDDNDKEYLFHLILELVVEDKHYAYFQAADSGEEEDIEVLQVVKDENGELEVVYIEDDDEWEKAAEYYDEWSYIED